MIGASDAACALGCDRYKSPLTLWKELRGISDRSEKPAFVREAAECGQLLEPIVRAKYATTVQRAIIVPTESRTIDSWLRSTPDGYVLPAEGHGFQPGHTYEEGHGERGRIYQVEGLLQCKTASAYKREEWDAGVPTEYEIQERVEMAVCDLPWADVFCLIGGQHFTPAIRVERDAALEDRILTDLHAFWRLVQEGIEPSPDHTAAWQQHAAERLAKLKARTTIAADAEMRCEIDAWRRARAAVKTAERERDELKNRILVRLASAGATAIELDRDTKVTAYQVGAKPKWKDYALSLGGQHTVPDKFKGTANSWALRAPDDEDEH